jgi:CubicO group peptidase (beta-lactamase class C family)
MKQNSSKISSKLEVSTDRTFFFSISPLDIIITFGFIFGLTSSAQESAVGSALDRSVGSRLAADLSWTQTERDTRFAHMEQLFPVHVVRHGRKAVRQLPTGTSLPGVDIAGYMTAEHLSGVLILQDGRVRAERYAIGLTPSGQWTSFSMTKAVTDTLAGAALRAGSLRSLDDSVVTYLPEMRGSAYDGVTVRQLMTMTSGVRWNENYTSADADNVRLYTAAVAAGKNSTLEYMRTLSRDTEPGTRWHYNTGETDLLGVLLRRATGRTLAEQLSATVWQQAGMEHDATWIATASGPAGEEFGGSGLSVSLRDFGRLGLWVLGNGNSRLPAGWFSLATSPQVKAGAAAYGYGWWPQSDGSFAALGIFGQSILIDPHRRLVIVTLGSWPEATGTTHTAARAAFWNSVKAAVDVPY